MRIYGFFIISFLLLSIVLIFGVCKLLVGVEFKWFRVCLELDCHFFRSVFNQSQKNLIFQIQCCIVSINKTIYPKRTNMLIELLKIYTNSRKSSNENEIQNSKNGCKIVWNVMNIETGRNCAQWVYPKNVSQNYLYRACKQFDGYIRIHDQDLK